MREHVASDHYQLPSNMSIAQKSFAKIAALAVAISLVVGFAFVTAERAQAAALTSAQISSIISLLQSFGADSTTIANVQASLMGQPTSGSTGGSTSSVCPFTWTRNLTTGATGADVLALQKFLNSDSSTQVAVTGAGSPGNETQFFGPATGAAVTKFQVKYAAQILTPLGLTNGTAFFGASSRAKANELCASGGSTGGNTGGNTGGTTTGTGLMVSAGVQPQNSLAPASANRVPFTTFTLTAGNDGDVTVNGITVQRTGLAQDAAFSGVVLVDNSTGAQLDISKTFNSNHQAVVGGSFVVPRGISKSFTVAGNMSSDETLYAGQAAQLSVVAVNTTATVSGSLPITGATQTINSTLTLGTVTANTSSYDPGTTANKQIGTTGIRFSAMRLTAGSAEDITVHSIRWNQTGSAGSGDLANLMTVVNGTSYPTMVDATGKYYTTTFPAGVVVTKGNSIDVYLQGDLVGPASANRTVEFDIYKSTDIYITGNTYGYGITPGNPSATGVFRNDATNPWFTGYVVTIQAGTASTIQNNTSVAAQNVAVNVPNQPLGGFQTTILGEPISVQGMYFAIATSGTATGQITSVSLVDQNGTVVAGPVDASNGDGTHETATCASAAQYCLLHFTDTITLPTGTNSYHLVGKLPTTFSNGSTVILKTNPGSDWSNVTGQTTGNTISLTGNGAFQMNTMTVQSATTTIANASQPSSQNVVPGAQGFVFANIQLDGTQSGEDVRLSSLPLVLTVGAGGAVTDLTACQLWNGSTSLNTGSNVINSNNIQTSGSKTTFNFDNALTIPKGTVVTLALSCNLSSSAANNATYSWSKDAVPGDYNITGVQSGVSVTPSLVAGNAPTMTASTGAFTATAAGTAIAQPALAQVPAGSTGVTVGFVKFHATNEAVNLTKVGLTLTHGTYGSASTGSGHSSASGAGDVTLAYIYNGSTLVGTASFSGSQTTATTTLSTPVTLAKDADMTLTIKADIAPISVSGSAGIGDTLAIDPLNAQGTGAASGKTLNVSATSGVNGVQLFKSVPTVANNSSVSCSNSSTPVCTGTTQTLKQFTVTANNAGPVSVEQLKFFVSTSSANVTNLLVQVLDNGNNVATSTFGSTQCSTGCTAGQSAGTSAVVFTGGPVIIPAGTSYTFKLLADVAPTATTWSVNAKLKGTSAAIAGIGSTPTYIGTTTAIANADANSNFIWSDNATTTAGANDVDWFNGYQVSGLNGSAGF